MPSVARMRLIWFVLILSVLAGLWAAWSLFGPQRSIVVGFSGTLEGRYSDLGVQGRNGAMLALEEINQAGGVAGSPLRLVAAHDGGTPQGAVQADLELAEAGAVAILGHMTSSLSMAALDGLSEQLPRTDIPVFISPTTSTPTLSGRDDVFFRVMPTNVDWAHALAFYAIEQTGGSRMAVVRDSDNESYTSTFSNAFVGRFVREGGTMTGSFLFSSSRGPDWAKMAASILAGHPDVVMVSASARDCSALARHIRLRDRRTRLYFAPWAYTRELFLAGGRAVEDAVTVMSYAGDSDNPRYRRFRKDFKSRFGFEPGFAAVFSYEAAMVLALALEATDGKREGLEKALTGIHDFPGLMGTFSFNEYGDVIRPSFVVTIKGAAFHTLDTVED